MSTGSVTRHRTFVEFFRAATGDRDPYPYQNDLSQGDIPDMLSIPTGAGKTEAAVLSIWMWRRMSPDEGVRRATPRRLVYCLPMRTLVEQTRERINGFIEKLGLVSDNRPAVVTLMGSEVDREYMKRLDRDMIIVGTQDMLLSRALNRGYVATPFMWPVEFAVLNNDSMWIMDEVQLMGDGLATSAQLDAFRRNFHTFGPHKTVWMSATIDPGWLDTVDNADVRRTALALRGDGPGGDMRQLSITWPDGREESKPTGGNSDLDRRNNARKPLHVLDNLKKGDAAYSKPEAKKLWKVIKEKRSGRLALVITNTVKRAQSLYGEFSRLAEPDGNIEVVLIHSRFRRKDRSRLMDRVLHSSRGDGAGKNAITVVVSTQVVEAGVDMSAGLLITENAPWASLVQRFGRCNREGDLDDAKICVIPMSTKAHRPYDPEDLAESERLLKKYKDKSMSPAFLSAHNEETGVGRRRRYRSVLRRQDLLGLFDTAPDLSGGYTDVARYVRSVDETGDVHVFWRRWDKSKEFVLKLEPNGDEVCAVPIGDMSAFAKAFRGRVLYRRDHAEGVWVRIRPGDARPGQTLLLHADDGGYTKDTGWDPSSDRPVEVISVSADDSGDSPAADPLSSAKRWVTLYDHTAHVFTRLDAIQKRLSYDKWPADEMREAAVLHDLGKAHAVFQNAIRDENSKQASELWAKSDGSVRRRYVDPATKRPIYFRHEAVSAAAILCKAGAGANKRDQLIAYVVAAHHGKIRLSMRNPPVNVKSGRYYPYDTRYVAGVHVEVSEKIPNFLSKTLVDSRADAVPKIDGWDAEYLHIKPDVGRIGALRSSGMSWLEMAQSLLEEKGPFRLALLEAALRAADMLASAEEQDGTGGSS